MAEDSRWWGGKTTKYTASESAGLNLETILPEENNTVNWKMQGNYAKQYKQISRWKIVTMTGEAQIFPSISISSVKWRLQEQASTLKQKR